MEIYFDKSIEPYFKDFKKLQRNLKMDLIRVVKKRLVQIEAAETFLDYLDIGLGKPHPLKGNKFGSYTISLSGNVRLIVRPLVEDMSIESLRNCKKILIERVEDYHGSKTTIYIP